MTTYLHDATYIQQVGNHQLTADPSNPEVVFLDNTSVSAFAGNGGVGTEYIVLGATSQVVDPSALTFAFDPGDRVHFFIEVFGPADFSINSSSNIIWDDGAPTWHHVITGTGSFYTNEGEVDFGSQNMWFSFAGQGFLSNTNYTYSIDIDFIGHDSDPAHFGHGISGDRFGQGVTQLTTGDDNLIFGAGNDTVFALAGNDTLAGAAGDDLIYGNQDNDLIDAFPGTGAGNDTLYGGQGFDTIGNASNTGNDVIYGNFFNDVINGGTGHDTLYGGQGNDSLSGNSGNDVLVGNLGDDTMSGGPGADAFVFAGNSGNDVIFGFSQAEGDKIRIFLQAGDPAQVGWGDDGHGGTLVFLPGGGTVDLIGVQTFSDSAVEVYGLL